MTIKLSYYGGLWRWFVWYGPGADMVAYGTSPDYDEACRCARIAWEQHSKEEET